VAAGAAFDAQRQNIIDGLDSAQAEATGWDAVVKAGLAVTDVVRTSATVVTVTLPAFGGYDITATETITAMIPSTAVVGGSAIVAAPTFNIGAISAALTGTVTDDNESDIRAGGSNLILTLTNDTWVAAGAAFDAQRQNIIDGLDSAQAEAAGWDAVVKAGLAVTDVVRTSATVVTITLPAFGGYNITATEFITATIPATAVAAGSAIVASPTFDVTADTNWYDNNWRYRKTVSLDGTNFCTTVNAFPVPVTLTGDADLQADARADGFDILFTADDGLTKLPHEIETFTKASGDLVAWVKLDIVSGMNQTLYMYYGNAGATDQQDKANVWDANFVGIWHLDESGNGTADEFEDSSGTGNHGQGGSGDSGRTPAQITSGQIGNAQDFDGIDNFIDVGTMGSFGSTLVNASVTLWLRTTQTTKSQVFGTVSDGTSTLMIFSINMKENTAEVEDSLRPNIRDEDAVETKGDVIVPTFNDGTWHMVTIVYKNSSDIDLYFDGVEQTFNVLNGGPTDNMADFQYGLLIGANNQRGTPTNFTDVDIDEFRISNIARSADWIQAEVCTAGGVVGGTGPPEYPAVTSAVAEIAPNAVGAGSTGNAFTYDILPTVGASDTGVNQVVITAPAGYASLNVTAVSLNAVAKTLNCPSPGAGQYCAAIAGQDITVTLGDQGGDGQVIQVIFDADAPGSTGSADFSATVDDTATSATAQATTAGNADGDGADNNSQAVTVNPAAALSGTVTDDSETEIRTGGSTIIMTLTGETWVAAGAAFDAQRQNIIDGLDSAQAEAAGWDAVVKAGLAVTDVVRTSDTVVTVTLPAFGGYDITAAETITATIPATAVAGGSAIVASPTFDVTVIAEAALSGTVTDDSETEIRTGGSTIVLILTGDTWVAVGAAFDAERQNIIDGLDSAQAEAAGWDAVVKAGLAVTDVVRTSDTVVTVTLPAFGGFDITATETITATIPATAVAGGSAIVASPTFDVAVIAEAASSGTVTDDSETEIRTGGSTIILTLTGDTWVAVGAVFDAERQNIIDGLDSAQAEAAGWDAVVKAGLAVTDVVRSSDTVVTITLPAFGGYDITATETITATVPATAVAGGSAIVAAPTFDVTVIAEAALSGTATDDSETEIRTGGSTIVLTLTGDTWVAAGAAFDAQRQNIIDGLDSAQAEAAGWDAVVKAGFAVTDVVRTSDTVVTVTLPAFGGYDITATETITATIPTTAVAGGSAIVAAPTFDVAVSAGTVALTGTVTDDSELDIRTGGSTIILTLTDDTWVAAGAAFDAERQNIIDGLDSAQAEAAGWDAVVKAGLAVTDVVRTRDHHGHGTGLGPGTIRR
jgi:hypothetical protein